MHMRRKRGKREAEKLKHQKSKRVKEREMHACAGRRHVGSKNIRQK